MLFEIGWHGISGYWEHRKKLADAIREAPPEDAFVFILTKSYQVGDFTKWVQEYELKDCIKVESEPLTNRVHKDNGRNLVIYVMSSDNNIKIQEYKQPVRRPRQLVLGL